MTRDHIFPQNAEEVGAKPWNSGGRWRHFFLDSGATAQCELVLTVPSRNILTYLLTLFPWNLHV